MVASPTSKKPRAGFKTRRGQELERVKGIEPSSSAWKAVALPLSYTRIGLSNQRSAIRSKPAFSDGRLLITDGGGGRTRTYEGVSQRIYSPPPLPLGTLPRTPTNTWYGVRKHDYALP